MADHRDAYETLMAAFDGATELGAILEDARNEPAPQTQLPTLGVGNDAPPRQIEVVCPACDGRTCPELKHALVGSPSVGRCSLREAALSRSCRVGCTALWSAL